MHKKLENLDEDSVDVDASTRTEGGEEFHPEPFSEIHNTSRYLRTADFF